MSEILIETYEELQESPKDQAEIDTYNQTVIDLGLEHLAIKEDKVPIAPMSDLEYRVYKVLCPKTTDLNDYTHVIPIRVLKAYKKCKEYLEEFSTKTKLKVKIYEDQDPDPIMIAEANYSDYFLIGRWGKELQDFPTLLKRAKEKAVADKLKDVQKAREFVELYDKDKDAFGMALIRNSFSTIYM